MYSIARHMAERENRGKAKKISFAIHLVLLLLLLIPIIRPNLERKDFERSIVIDFSEQLGNTGSTKKSGSGNEAMKPAAARQKVEIAQIEAKQVPQQPQMQVPERKEIITMPTPELPVPKVQEPTEPDWNEVVEEVEIREEVPDLLPEPVEEIVKEEPKEALPDVAVTPEETVAAPSGTEGWADFGKTRSDAQASGTGDGDKGDLAGKGKGDGGDGAGTGKGDAGKDTGKGNQGTGNFWGNLPGDGRLTRQVVKYADAKSLAGITGKAVLNLCVNRPGKVVYVEYDASRSSITDAGIIRQIQDLVRKYEFEQDYSAPTQQCGKYTFEYSVED